MSLDPQLQKLPPQNIEAEQKVLGAVLTDAEAINRIVDLVRPEDFYRAAHQTIFAAMLAMADAREPIDLVTLPERLRGSNSLESVGGASYLATLVSLTPTSANIPAHARIVRDKALLRGMIHAANAIASDGYDEDQKASPAELLDRAEARIFAIGEKRSGGMLVPMKNAIGPSFAIVEERYDRKGSVVGLETGFVDLDEMTAGLQQGNLVIVAGRPSMGKTAFALNIAAYAAIQKKKKAAIFSLEMSREELVLRMLGSEARVNANRIRTGKLQERDWKPLSDAAGALAEAEIAIDDTAAISALELRARARRMKAETGLDLVIVDYLQLMRGTGEEKNREQEISGISRSLKALAKELRVPVIALSQLNRGVETRAERNKRPQLSDLRESGAIEQDADVIIFLYREEIYNKCTCAWDAPCLCMRRGTAEAIVGKQRNGPTGTVDLTFMGKWTRFENGEKKQY